MSTEVAYDAPSRTSTSGSPGTTDSGLTYANPTGPVGTMFVSGGVITGNPGGGSAAPSATLLDAGSTDCGIFAVVSATAPAGTLFLGARCGTSVAASVKPNSGYCITLSPGTSIDLIKSGSTIAAGAVTTPVVAGDEVGLVCKGSMIYIIVNGVTVYSYTDASPLTTGTNTMLGQLASSLGVGGFTKIRVISLSSATGYPYRVEQGWKMPWHIDGSTHGFSTQAAAINSELGGSGVGNSVASVVFPEPRKVAGVFLAGGGGFGGGTLYIEFLDASGTNWGFNAGSAYAYPTVNGFGFLPGPGAWRTNGLWAGAFPLVRGVRAVSGASGTVYSFHLYGYVPQQPGVHRLRLWHPYLDIPLPGDYFDLGDIGRTTIRNRFFRLKNISTTLTANSISVDVRSDAYSTTLTDQFGLRKASDTAGTYVPTAVLSALAPNTVSEIFEWRRITPSNQAYQMEAPYVRMQTGSFS